MKVVVATGNSGKLRELTAGLVGLPGLPLEISAWDGALPPETGTTLHENARIKARTVSQATGCVAIGDDTGLEVDALDGAPGVRSARYAGDECDPARNIAKLLGELQQVPDALRIARFRCVLCLATPTQADVFVEGVCEGRILREPRGHGGFGYDPVFFLPQQDATMAELSLEQKNAVSHRGQAVRALRAVLENYTRAT